MTASAQHKMNGSALLTRSRSGKVFSESRNTLLKEGVTFRITGSDRTALYTANAACNTSAMLCSSAKLAGNEEVTFSAEDSQTDSTVRTGTVSTGMGGMRGYGGQRPYGEQPDGSESPKKTMMLWLRKQVIQRKHNKAKRYRRGYLTEG